MLNYRYYLQKFISKKWVSLASSDNLNYSAAVLTWYRENDKPIKYRLIAVKN